MTRRELLLVLAAAPLLRPFEGRAQQSTIETIGFLHAGSSDSSTDLAKAFQKGLSQAGYVRDENIAIDYRWANGQDDQPV
jgi:putative ABC transport system substrate-binding protein